MSSEISRIYISKNSRYSTIEKLYEFLKSKLNEIDQKFEVFAVFNDLYDIEAKKCYEDYYMNFLDFKEIKFDMYDFYIYFFSGIKINSESIAKELAKALIELQLKLANAQIGSLLHIGDENNTMSIYYKKDRIIIINDYGVVEFDKEYPVYRIS